MLWLSPALRGNDESASTMPPAKLIDPTPLTSAELFTALLPWIILCAILLIWGTGWFKAAVNPIFTWNYPVPELHNMINKVAPVVPTPTKEGAVFAFTYLSFTGTGMLIAAIIAGSHHGTVAGQDRQRIRTHHQTVRVFADHDLGDAGDRHPDPALRR